MLSREERARIFLPFSALNGFNEALKEKEIEIVERKELSEEMIYEISNKLSMLEKGMTVEIEYYCNKQYIKQIGVVEKIDTIKKELIIDKNSISFIDILILDIK